MTLRYVSAAPDAAERLRMVLAQTTRDPIAVGADSRGHVVAELPIGGDPHESYDCEVYLLVLALIGRLVYI